MTSIFVSTFICEQCQNPLELDSSLLNIQNQINLDPFIQTYQKPLSESFILLPNRIETLNASNEITNQHPTLSKKLEKAEKFIEMLNETSLLDHPLCKECTLEFINTFINKLQTIEKENKMIESFLKSRNVETMDLSLEIKDLERQEMESRIVLTQLQEQHDDILLKIKQVELEKVEISKKESKLWKELNWKQADLDRDALIRKDIQSKLDSSLKQIEILKSSNVYNDAFRIWHEGSFGTINGMRIGKLKNQPVAWTEINCGLGQALLLLDVLAKKVGFEFTNYRLVPMGSVSKIEKITPETGIYELYSSGELSGFSLFGYRKFDLALLAFIDCIQQLGDYAESHDPKFRLPYKIRKEKIGDVSIKLLYNQEESWTKAMKYTLINLKWIMAFVSSNPALLMQKVDLESQIQNIDLRYEALLKGEFLETKPLHDNLFQRFLDTETELETFLESLENRENNERMESCLDQINVYYDSILEYFEDYGYELKDSDCKEPLNPKVTKSTPTSYLQTPEKPASLKIPLSNLQLDNYASPTLENLGISSFTWKLINGDRSTPIKPTSNNPISPTEHSFYESPGITYQQPKTYETTYGTLIQSVSEQELKMVSIPNYEIPDIRYINTSITEINDHITDRRFSLSDFGFRSFCRDVVEDVLKDHVDVCLKVLVSLNRIVAIDDSNYLLVV